MLGRRKICPQRLDTLSKRGLCRAFFIEDTWFRLLSPTVPNVNIQVL